jgi:D-glycero-D-manno-heptose 1,7-bisphosphate phosphatase
MNRAIDKGIFLDRDGTLIDVMRDEETGVIGVAFHPDHVRLLPGVVEGLKLLADAGYALGIASNQPGPAKGQFSAKAVERTNARLLELLAAEGISIAAVKVCMHHEKGGPGGDPSLVGPCRCRKPKPGLLEDLLTELRIAKENAWMIGDSPGDVQAARAAGIRAGLVFDTKRCELCPLRPRDASGSGSSTVPGTPDVHGPTLLEIARAVVALAP